ncbi:MAG: glycosyltransferase family 39 protein [Candidatus Aenigmarchaeota archaeon]|nr:glycosyltransferase family 39 protein [Candidatus Aenigmarchaeota archaeon]
MKLKWILVVIIIISIVLRTFFLHPTFSDENFYFNVGKTILEGKAPYKDFFFAHPPLQVYALALLFKVFGTSFIIGKMLTLIMSSLCVVLTFLILGELFDEKTALITGLIFLITPAFLAFSTMGHGMWETTVLVLLSTYLLIKNKSFLSGISLVVAIFFRYLAVIYFPFFIVLLYLRKNKSKRFLISFILAFFVLITLILSIFGSDYVNQTISYHVFSKVAVSTPKSQGMQYWGMGYFFLFLSLISGFFAYTKKDKLVLLFSLTPLIADILILLGLKLIFYHYFFISLAFCVIATGRTLTLSRDRIVRIMIPIILFLSIVSNTATLDFYLNPSYAKKYYSIGEFIQNNTSEHDKIFGEPVVTNYVSFVTGRKISSGYLDSYLQHLMFEGENRIIQSLDKEKPKFIIEMENYYMVNPYFRNYIINNYNLKIIVPGTPEYSVYSRVS